ncbi:hypothetical protein [Desulfocicer vacuolatum]|nr:hypothetical protein [Desulfocicer vacuolatum]
MRYSKNLRRILIFVVGRTGSEYGLPMAVKQRNGIFRKGQGL